MHPKGKADKNERDDDGTETLRARASACRPRTERLRQKDAPDAPEQTAQTAAYSNLSDEASKELLSELFADAGIAAERADKFFACLDQFNGSVKAEWLTDGFETAAPTETKYDPYEMQEMWMERQGDFPGYNCRITAYELMGDRITAGEDQPDTNGEGLALHGP